MQQHHRFTPILALAAFGLILGAGTASAAPPGKARIDAKRVQLLGGHAKPRLIRRARQQPHARQPDARQQAQDRLRAGDRPGALRAFERAALREPLSPYLWRMVGDLAYHLGQRQKAVDAWVRAADLAPKRAALLDRVARGATALGDFELATEHQRALVDRLGQLLEQDPSQTHFDLMTGKRVEVRRLYRKHLWVLSELAVLAGDFTSGETAARDLIRLEPSATEGLLALAYVHLQAAEYDDAESLYRDVLQLQPDNTTALNNLGNIYYMRRDLDEAAESFERILEVSDVSKYSESIALSNLGELLQLAGAYRPAERLYQQAIEARPEGAWGYMGLAALYELTGDYDEATEQMISGWERDQNRMTRLNMRFFQSEWAWQRDAMIAEIEGEFDLAQRLWLQILDGDVDALRKSAAHHLRSLELADAG